MNNCSGKYTYIHHLFVYKVQLQFTHTGTNETNAQRTNYQEQRGRHKINNVNLIIINFVGLWGLYSTVLNRSPICQWSQSLI